MEIHNMRLDESPGGNTVARFDLQITPELRLLHWVIKRTPDGRLRSFPPSVKYGGNSSASLAPELLRAVIAASTAAYLSLTAGDPQSDQRPD